MVVIFYALLELSMSEISIFYCINSNNMVSLIIKKLLFFNLLHGIERGGIIMKYNELLKVMIDTSGVFIKEYSSALNYDASYISKWLHGVNLPVRKMSNKINTTSAKYFANQFWDNYKLDELKFALRNTEIYFPEVFHTQKELEDFLFKLFSSSYMESAHPAPKDYLKATPNLPHLNAYVSDDLDGMLKALHSHCKFMVHTKKVLQIYSTMPTDLLTRVIASHNESHCMLFRAKQVELNYFIPFEVSTMESLVDMTVIANVLRTLNAESNIKLRYSDLEYTTQFVYTQGCYFLFRMKLGDKDLYYLIDNPDLINQYEPYIESLILASENAGNINTTAFTNTMDYIGQLLDSDNFIFSGRDFFLLLTLMSSSASSNIATKIKDDLLFAIRNTFRSLLREKHIDFYLSNDAVFDISMFQNECLYETHGEITPEDILKLSEDLFFAIEGNEDVRFHIYEGETLLNENRINTLICDKFIRLAYFGKNGKECSGDIMYSENPVLINNTKKDLMETLEEKITDTFTPNEMFAFMVEQLKVNAEK